MKEERKRQNLTQSSHPEKTKVRQNEKTQNFDSGNKVKQVEQKQNPKMNENSTKVNFFTKEPRENET